MTLYRFSSIADERVVINWPYRCVDRCGYMLQRSVVCTGVCRCVSQTDHLSSPHHRVSQSLYTLPSDVACDVTVARCSTPNAFTTYCSHCNLHVCFMLPNLRLVFPTNFKSDRARTPDSGVWTQRCYHRRPCLPGSCRICLEQSARVRSPFGLRHHCQFFVVD